MFTRIAPTPSGFLHAGNAYSFLLTASLAKKESGKILLRIDDLDRARIRSEYIRDIFETLQWLGVHWDAGPKDPEDFKQSWSQSLRIPRYQELIRQLCEIPGLVFACTCSRSELAGHSRYPGHCRKKNLPLDLPDAALRVQVPEDFPIRYLEEGQGWQEAFPGKESGSFILRRRDGLPAYHIASLADDVAFGMDCIVRGVDLLPSTACQMFLAQQLGLSTFTHCSFVHHSLILGKSGEKLSKSQGASSIREAREKGMTPQDYFRNFPEFTELLNRL